MNSPQIAHIYTRTHIQPACTCPQDTENGINEGWASAPCSSDRRGASPAGVLSLWGSPAGTHVRLASKRQLQARRHGWCVNFLQDRADDSVHAGGRRLQGVTPVSGGVCSGHQPPMFSPSIGVVLSEVLPGSWKRAWPSNSKSSWRSDTQLRSVPAVGPSCVFMMLIQAPLMEALVTVCTKRYVTMAT